VTGVVVVLVVPCGLSYNSVGISYFEDRPTSPAHLSSRTRILASDARTDSTVSGFMDDVDTSCDDLRVPSTICDSGANTRDLGFRAHRGGDIFCLTIVPSRSKAYRTAFTDCLLYLPWKMCKRSFGVKCSLWDKVVSKCSKTSSRVSSDLCADVCPFDIVLCIAKTNRTNRTK
jgi:hypothetical protein